MPKGLTRKQRVFIDEYLRCWNATEAARRAGYSERSACFIGHENLTKPYIAQEIDARIAELKISADEVLIRLAEHARGSLEDFVNPLDGTISLRKAKRLKKLHLVKSYSNTGKGVRIELYDAQGALEKIGKHLKLLTDRYEVDLKGGLTLRVVEEIVDADADTRHPIDGNDPPDEDTGGIQGE